MEYDRNGLLEMIDKFLVDRKTGDIVDKWCEDLHNQIEQGYPEPEWTKYPLGTSYYRINKKR